MENARALTSEELHAIAQQAEDFSKKHIVEISNEMVQWRNTSLLGEGRVRELERILTPLAGSYALGVTESYAQRAAYEFVVQQGKASE